MSVSTISPPTVPTAQASHHAHRSHAKGGSSAPSGSSATSPTADPKSTETLQQLADEGDPTAIAELKAENPQPHQAGQEAHPTATEPQTGAKEPGKGEEVDVYV